MSFRDDHEDEITERAARWLGVLLDGNDRQEDFFRWVDESPRHVEEFLFVLADAQDIAMLTPEQRARLDELSCALGTSTPGVTNIVPVSNDVLRLWDRGRVASDSGRRTHRALKWVSTIAATLLVGLSAAWWLLGPGAWETYSTGVGEQRAIELPDGSVVHLNTMSSVDIRLSESLRSVRLMKGEALFSVAHDARRPFLVQTSDAVVQAIGTRFVVYRRPGGTRVAVIEGLVRVADTASPGTGTRKASLSSDKATKEGASGERLQNIRLLAAGEATEVKSDGELSPTVAVDPAKATAWRQRRLVFEDDSLEEIASEFNRYNTTVQIRVVGRTALNARFSGTFDADAPEAMMQALTGDAALQVERNGNEIVIRGRETEP